MSHETQRDSEIESSDEQSGVPWCTLPAPLPGSLKLESKKRIGAYSDVYKGTWEHEGRTEEVCIKCLRNTAPGTDPSCPTLTPAERFQRRLKRETLIWIQSKHENVLPFLGYQIVDDEPRLVSPWMTNGSLETYLTTHPDISEVEKLRFLYQAAEGLAYLHNATPSIAHGDLKPENILIKDNVTAALCDMGVSRVILDGHTGLTTSGTAPGSAGFQAKELIMGESLPTAKSDVYAMGGVILETMSGKKPFYKARTHGMVILFITTDRICQPEDHPGLAAADSLWPFLRRCWDPNPEARPNAGDVVAELAKSINQRQFITKIVESAIL